MQQIESSDRLLNSRRRVTLKYYEEEIEKAGKSLSGVFKRLRSDREKPWLCDYASFDEYCEKRWGMTRRRQLQIIDAENTREILMGIAGIAEDAQAMKERSLRELKDVNPEEAEEIIREAKKESPKGKVTTGAIQKVKAKRNPPKIVEAEIIPPPVDGTNQEPCLCPHCGRPMP